MIVTKRVTPENDLQQLAKEINQASWDEANDMCGYSSATLSAYLNRQDTVFVVCHKVSAIGRTLLGIASARLEIKPYEGDRWLYVDEIDVCVDQRRQGAGKALMQKLFDIAQAADCEEVWLATEVDNQAAKAFYQSLEPDDVSEVLGYTYEMTPP